MTTENKTTTAEKPKTNAEPPREAQSKGAVALFKPPRLPYHPAIADRFPEIDKGAWRTLTDAIFPAAKTTDSIVLALSYCKARRLDIFKRVIHIVPIWDNEAKKYVETIWPGIAELRTTAFRTKSYAGMTEPKFGPDIEHTFEGMTGGKTPRKVTKKIRFPEWCQCTVKRIVSGHVVEFVGPKVYWIETFATMGRSGVPNEMWEDRPRGQLEKCAEAAALRRAFPEELGSDHIPDEVGHAGVREPGDDAEDITPRPTREEAKAETAAAAGQREAGQSGSEEDAGGEPTGEEGEGGGGEDEAAATAFTVLSTEGTVYRPAGDAAEFTVQLIELVKSVETADDLAKLLEWNKDDIARLTPEQRQEVNAACNARTFKQKGAAK